MADPAYEAALKRARRELDELLEERIKLDVRVARLKRFIESLIEVESGVDEGSVALAQIAFEEGVGLTEGIRIVLRESQRPVKAPEIRDQLKTRGYDLTSYVSELAAIHNTVKRMIRQGEIVEHHSSTGRLEGWTLKSSSRGAV